MDKQEYNYEKTSTVVKKESDQNDIKDSRLNPEAGNMEYRKEYEKKYINSNTGDVN